MFCSKCGKELPEGSTSCPNCDKNESSQIKNEVSSNNTDEVVKKKKKSAGPIIAILLILVLLAGGAFAAYYFFFNKQKNVFSSLINSSFEAFEKEYKKEKKISTQNLTTELAFEIDSNLDEIKEVADILNSLSIKCNTQVDMDNKKGIIKLDTSLDKEDLINLECFLDAKNKKTYLFVDELFEKYFEIDLKDLESEELNNLIDEAFEKESNADAIIETLKIAKEELVNNLPKDNITKENDEIEINDKTIKVTKNTLKLSDKETYKFLRNYCNSLVENEKFIENFEDIELDLDIEKELNTIIEDLDDLLEDGKFNKNNYIEFSVYTKGLKNEIVKNEITISAEDEKVVLEITKADNKTYDFIIKINEDGVELKINGSYEIDKVSDTETKETISIKIPQLGSLKLKVNTTNIINEKIDDINTKNSVNINDLTDEDLHTIQENLQKMPIYTKYLKSFIESQNTTSNNSITPNNNVTPAATNSTSSNELVTYDGKTKITFSVPSNYKSSYSADEYKSFSTDDYNKNVTLNTSTYTTSSYYEKSLKSSFDYMQKDTEYYKNVKLSEPTTLDINGITYYTATLSYTFGTSYTLDTLKTYYYTAINDKQVYCVEVNGTNTLEDIKPFLEISISNN